MSRRSNVFIDDVGPVSRGPSAEERSSDLPLFSQSEPRGMASTSLDAKPVAEACSRQEATILQMLLAVGPSGLTREEIAESTGIKLQSVCGRVFTLRDTGKVFERLARSERRNGSKVVVHASFAPKEASA